MIKYQASFLGNPGGCATLQPMEATTWAENEQDAMSNIMDRFGDFIECLEVEEIDSNGTFENKMD